MRASRSVVVVLVVVALGGCAGMRKDKYCRWGFPAWGAVLGGTGAGLGVSKGADSSSGEVAGAAAGGAVTGALIGAAIGYFVCEPEEAPPVPAAAPPPPAPPARGTKIAEIPGPNFAFDKASLTPAGRQTVKEAARLLKDNPTVRVSVDGYTDSVGTDAYNQRLSERRARTVADALVEEGIERSRLHVRGLGESNPVADNKTAEGRARNRRVEVVVE